MMSEYENGYILPHLSEYLGLNSEGQFIHGKLGGELVPISREEAAKRVMYNFYEQNAWNMDGVSILVEHPKTDLEIAMNHFAEEVGVEYLEVALKWCQDISYKVVKGKKDFFENLLSQSLDLETVSRAI